MIKLGKYQYCEIKNPVIRGKDGELQHDKFGQVIVNMGDSEYRNGLEFTESFPLYPNEQLVKILDIQTIPRTLFGKVIALREFMDGEIQR